MAKVLPLFKAEDPVPRELPELKDAVLRALCGQHLS